MLVIFGEEDIKEYDIVVAWGSALLNHKATMMLKMNLLTLIKKKALVENVKCLVTDNLFVDENYGVHPLFLKKTLLHSRK